MRVRGARANTRGEKRGGSEGQRVRAEGQDTEGEGQKARCARRVVQYDTLEHN